MDDLLQASHDSEKAVSGDSLAVHPVDLFRKSTMQMLIAPFHDLPEIKKCYWHQSAANIYEIGIYAGWVYSNV